MAYRIKGDVEVARNLHVSGNLTVDGTSPGGGDSFFYSDTANLVEQSGSLRVTGSVTALGGLSGSLTALTDGSPYLIAGSNITLTTGSGGEITINSVNTGSVTNVVSGSEWITLYDVDFTTFANQDIQGDGNLSIPGTTGTFTWQRNNSSATQFMSYSNGVGLQFSLNTTNSDFNNTTRTAPLIALPLSGVIPSTFNFNEIDLKIEAVVSSSNQGQDFESIKTVLEISSALASPYNIGITKVHSTALQQQFTVTTAGTSTNNSITYADENVFQFFVLGPDGADSFTAANSTEILPAPDQYQARASSHWGDFTNGQLLDPAIPENIRDLNWLFVVGSANTAGDLIGTLKKFRIQYRPKGGILSQSNGSGGDGNLIWQSDVANVAFTTGSVQITGSVTANGGLSGSLTTLTDGSPYLLAGANITLATGSNGAVTITSTASGGGDVVTGSLLSFGITDYATTNATASSPEAVGQLSFDPSEYTGPVHLRSILSTTVDTVTASVRLFNVTSGAFVEVGGVGITTLETTSSNPSLLESVNLRGATNFATDRAIYELQGAITTGSQFAFIGGAELRVTGAVTAPPTRLSLGSYTISEATSSNPQAVGGGYFVPSEHNTNTCVFRAVVSTTTASNSAVVQLYNITSGAFVEIGGTGITELSSTANTPTNVESVNLLNAINFDPSSAAVYEVRVYGSGSASPITTFMNSELVCS